MSINVEKLFRANREIHEGTKRDIDRCEDLFVGIANELNLLPESREKSLMITKLQEAKFWAVEAITKHPVEFRRDE